ncbi:unnamed protein product [Rotaria sp. Silwood2]|nr:unnamed protein product [Rotaria sp. Silwood2]
MIDQHHNPVLKYTAWTLFNIVRAALLVTGVVISISAVGMTTRREQYLWLGAPLSTLILKSLLSRFGTIPELFEHEESIALRSYLLPDRRDEFFIELNSSSPAAGTLIMINYQLMFQYRPVNSTITNDDLIVSSFSISPLMREKRLSGQFRLDNSNIYLHNGIQLRSAIFQV